ncbi:MAG: hypothetical protein JWM40_9 [Frankiales bacterium]|nr:hypothetical protein [Frankiales bacterium]
MPRDVFLLLGFPGTGKYTVAKALLTELERRGTTTRLVDAHYVNNPIFGLVHKDGITPLDPKVWLRVEEVRQAMLQTIEELSPPDWTFVFTNFITENDVKSKERTAAYVERLSRIASSGGGRFLAIRLICDVDELASRIVGQDRAERMKMLDPHRVRSMVAAETIHDPGNALTLDITALQPAEAVARILEFAEGS